MGRAVLADRQRIFKNTFRDIQRILAQGKRHAVRDQVHDIGHLYTAAHFLDGLVRPPLSSSRCSACVAASAAPGGRAAQKRLADRLFRRCLPRGCSRRAPDTIAAMSAVMGKTCASGWRTAVAQARPAGEIGADQVAKARRISRSWCMATPNEAREMLKLKGGRNVGF
jgi:uncharacterized protein (DUF849 family)